MGDTEEIRCCKTITVVAKPNSRKNQIVGYSIGRKAWMINVKAAADKDEANRELLRFLKKETKKAWVIKSGLHSRKKTLIALRIDYQNFVRIAK